MQHDQEADGSGAWAWGPYAITALTAGFGWVLRLAAGGMGLAVAAGLLLVPPIVLAVAYARGRYLLGVDRRGELVYAAGVLVALASWTGTAGTAAWPEAALVSAAVAGAAAGWQAYGPGQRPAGLAVTVGFAAAVLAALLLGATREPNPARWAVVWLTGTTLAAGPWWRYQRTRRRPAETPPVITDVQLLTHAIVKHLGHRAEVVPDSLATGDRGRYSVRYLLADGRNHRHLQAIAETVEGELGLRPGAVHIEGSRTRRNEAVVTIVPADPTVEQLTRPEPPATITHPVPLGRHDTGAAMQLAIYSDEGARGGLLGGQKGSGKSRLIWTLLHGWTATSDMVCMFGDMSGGATSTPWAPCSLWTETEPDRVLTQIRALKAAAVARAATLPHRGWESWQPSPAHPAIVFVIDEAQQLLKNNYQAQSALSELMQIDRKSGISVIVACPNPSMDEGIHPTVRQQCAVRLCMKAMGTAVNWVLQGTPALRLADVVVEFDRPGQVLGSAPGLAALPGRAYDTPLPDAKAAAIRNAPRRPTLDQLTADAIRKVAGDAFPTTPTAVAGAVAPDRRAARDSWTDADDAAVRKVSTVDDAQLRERLRVLAGQDKVLGQPWPDRPEVPAIPQGRLSTQQALQVAREMLAQPGGTTPIALRRATGRSETWTFDLLGKWTTQGAARQTPDGRYITTTPAPQGDQ